MSSTSLPRRTAGLLAAGAIGLSVTFLGGGVASAEPVTTPSTGTEGEAPVAPAASLPVAGNVYMLAQHYGIAPQRVSAAILISTAFSILTVSTVIALVNP